MIVALAHVLTLAVGIAISPLAIVAVILMATAGKGRTNGTAFVLGCFTLNVIFVGAFVLWGVSAGAADPDSGPRLTIDIAEIVLGLALLALAVVQWRRRSHGAEPKWMGRLDTLSMPGAFLLGALISGPLSPKDVPLLIAASGRISQSGLPTGETIAVVIIFGALGVVLVAIPWMISVVAPNTVAERLAGLRRWLVIHHSVIMTMLFVLLGFKLLGAGVADWAGAVGGA